MVNNKIFFPQKPVQPIGTDKTKKDIDNKKTEPKTSFNDILQKKIEGELKISNHAQQRLQSRNIELTENDMNKIEEAVVKAREKGSKDSLVLMDDLAFVVSIKNNTIITAVDGTNLKENVFTNIDSAVIV
ncbi:hypothetical protein SYNTR_0578 [Candidatus Syntrophocurvum alkaliphilum]|uniref:Flagellar operon protein n=1 Tax=Candidatus Syntrophocurvum alkaliphilum TaxID=2293317 RepID=A0A6I6DFI7_9FIRM|nr:TIGR02530 family flagellar biosynthesis protein [Candidatus Syntrophocurvum alkaliphilum]QGT99171.1 hypothetical protein SYNTR_0578 [Candidatus Syntrophocurvum alkaliphilum]